MKHPNIVRLYDVIETDKYIGIIIEYASGGELFDHILAHRYLREKDAAKLFSQLISGVWYIHQKKIVHRDLKLENLLLDRNRNVIITDFGFANRFEHRSDDLMQTSCGSPCYAAPELVISEGSYVGSAVDIWSCGVILYAMLAGYLPFDDDPANPDGDNINLLYKYIVNTPLTFPEYVSDSARDLLRMMLVPDPSKRSSLQAVMRHPWLASYHVEPDPLNPDPTAFGRSVNELETAALEQHQQKRQAYQRMMKQTNVGSQSSRSRQERPDFNGASSTPIVHAQTASGTTRSRSTQPEYLYESPVHDAPNTSAPAAYEHGYNTEDDPFAAPGGLAPGNATIEVEPGARSTRHTIQVEYSDTRPSSKNAPAKRGRETTGDAGRETPKKQKARSRSRGAQESPASGHERRRTESAIKPLPTPPDVAEDVNRTPSKRTTRQQSSPTTPTFRERAPVPVPAVDFEAPSITLASPPVIEPSEEQSMYVDTTVQEKDTQSQASSKEGKHRRGLSGMGGGLSKMFGGSSTENENPSSSELAPTTEKEKSDKTSGKKSRRNTLTVMVGTIKSRAQRGRMSTTPVETSTSSATPSPSPLPNEQQQQSDTSVNGTHSYGRASRPDVDVGQSGHDLPASTAKSRGVMQWFRSKSKGRDSLGGPDNSVSTPNQSFAEQRQNTERGRPTTSRTPTREQPTPIHVTVLPMPAVPSASRPPRSQRPPSTPTEPGVMSGLANRFRNSVTVGGASGGTRARTNGTSNAPSAMRIHHGAVDQSTITTRPPPEVMQHVRQILLDMGIEVQDEMEFKYRCIRIKRKKVPGAINGSGSNVAAFTMVGSAGSNGVSVC